MSPIDGFNTTVGRIAGGIVSDIVAVCPTPEFVLVQPITFKVRKVLEHVTDVNRMTRDQRAELASKIRIAVVPMLYSYEFDADTVNRLAPVIEAAAFRTLATGEEI